MQNHPITSGRAKAKVLVAGAGGIGSVVASRLWRVGCPTVIVDAWEPHVATIQRQGLILEEPDQTTRADIAALPLDCLDDLPIEPDVICLAVKAYDTARWALNLRESRATRGRPVLSLQNGYNALQLAEILGPSQVIAGIATFDGTLVAPGRARQVGPRGEIVIGELDGTLSERMERSVAVLSSVTSCHASSDITSELWTKLVRASGFGPVSILTNLGQSQICDDPQALAVAMALFGDAVRVAHRLGIVLKSSILWGLSPSALEAAPGSPQARQARRRVVEYFGPLTSLVPSMLRDVRAGRRSEVSYITGWLLEQARTARQPVPLTSRVLDLVQLVEAGGLTPHLCNAHRVAQEFALD
jgi:2-dehydropantoate 2-reductase